ncbi:MAG: HAD-IB family phosphatase [Crenarchaeota archaeon]|nr:HAD-IB family phosphatase [Thermoproteota archaeon]
MCKRAIRYAILDVDGVIIKHKSSWQYIHSLLGTQKIASIHREAALERKIIDYRDWAFVDVFLWRGSYKCDLYLSSDDLVPGAIELLRLLNRNRVKIFMVSGGLELAYELVRDYVDLYISNRLIYKNGRVFSVRVNVCSKDCIINVFERAFNIDWDRTLAIGDGSIDLPFISRARYSIAYNPVDDDVAKIAKFVVYGRDMYPVLSIVECLLDKTL